jgi:hypothetical protein
MDRDEYALLRRRPRLREAFQNAASRQPPSRSQLAEQLEAAGVPDDLVAEVIEDAAKLARDVHLGAKPFHVRQHADEIALRWAHRIDATDSLLPSELLGDDSPTADETAAAVNDAHAITRSGVHRNGGPVRSRPRPNVAWRQQ